MHTPNPDPNGRPAAVPRASGSGEPASPGKGSTDSHRTAPQPPVEATLSDLLRANSSSARRSPSAEDVAAHLAAPAGGSSHNPPADNSDDAPTVITHNGVPKPLPPPPPPYVVGEGPSIAGRRLGHFELIETIGAGGMAAVLRAKDLELGRIVALKILPPEAAHDTESVTRFKSEARAAAKLDHENIARVYFCGEDQGLHFIAFEFVEGITLRQMIDRRGPLPAGECLRYMVQVAAGLNHACERGVVHRDIKPSNIIITPDGRAKIVDMGLARHLDSASVNGGVTQSGVTLGTFDYISPEQALDPRRADVRSDIYSLGCTFYHALTGRPPVPEGTAAKKLHAHQHLWPLDPRELIPTIPDEVAAVLARMMAKEPADRYQTPNDLIAHLKGVAERLRLAIDSAVTDSAVKAVAADQRVLPGVPRVRLVWAVAAAAVVVAAVAIVISASGPPRTPMNPPWPGGDASDKKGDTSSTDAKTTTPPGPGGTQAADGTRRVSDVAGLVKALADANTTKVILVPGLYDLAALPQAVVFQGAQLELSGAGNVRVRVEPGSLTLKAAAVAVHGIRFEIAPPDEPAAAGAEEPAALAVQDAATLELRDCLFLPDEPGRRIGTPAVSVTSAKESAVHVRIERCLFAPGRVGLRLPSRSDVTVEDSGFGPQTAAIQIYSPKPDDGAGEAPDAPPAAPEATKIHFDRSTFMIDPYSAAVDVDRSADLDVRVRAGYCMFAPVGGSTGTGAAMMDRTGRGAVLRVAGEKPTGVRFEGVPDHQNAYYNVDPIALDKGKATLTFNDCQALNPSPAADAARVALTQRPWDAAAGNPTAAFGSPDPFRAFRVRLNDPSLAVLERAVAVLGVQFHRENLRLVYPDVFWPPNNLASADSKIKVWVPGGVGLPLPANENADLVTLLRTAKSGDTIRIRGNGLIPLEQTEIKPPSRPAADRASFQLTFEPEEGSHPILTPADSKDLDRTLFRIKEGEVIFNGLEFLVRTDRPADGSVVAAVTLVAARGCTFNHCTFTLAEEDAARMAAVIVANPSGVMKMDPANAGAVPQLRFENCLIRGKGRGVWMPVSRAMNIDLTNCVTAIDGPVVLAEPAGRGPAPGRTKLDLTHVTALLGGPLVELHAGKVGEMRATGLAPLDVTADRCLFAAVPGAGRPLIELHGIDPDDIRNVLTWTANKSKPNWYSFEKSAKPVSFPVGDEAGTVKNWSWDEWLGFAREPGGKPVGTVSFAHAPADLKKLAGVKPTDAEVKTIDFTGLEDAKLDDAGADLKKVARPEGE